jgi:choline dehydrogenase-like flavoprotein
MEIFRDFERSDKSSPVRGHAGGLHVSTVKVPHRTTEAFVESARAAGYTFNDDYNGPSQEGVSYLQRSLRNGFRCSAADAFLKPLLGGSNLEVLFHATVKNVQIVNGRATGATFVHKGRSRQVDARNIVLCAGAINSPKILMLSGIGSSEDLARNGIKVVLDRPEVGRNLKEHPVIRLVYRSRVPTYNLSGGLPQKLGILLKFLKHREGPMAVVYEGAAFLRGNNSNSGPEFQLLFAPLGVLGKIGHSVRLAPYPAFMIVLLRSHPRSSGCVRLASNNPNDSPLIECRLLAEEADIDALAEGIEVARNIMSKEPIASLIEMENTPGPTITSRATLAQFIRENTEVAFHPIGTCRMGSDTDAVVGPDLRVRGVENLWIADASIMPDHISANINAACMMIGAKLGRQLSDT